jgi:hypothetical protein
VVGVQGFKVVALLENGYSAMLIGVNSSMSGWSTNRCGP